MAWTLPKVGWRDLRGWAREFALIVLGVLVALWVNGWSEARADREREQASIEELLATTIANETAILAALDADSAAHAAARRYLTVLRSDRPLPPTDTLAAWTYEALSNSIFFPMTGTYEAIAQSGSLGLIRDDSLRAQVATYTGVLRGTAQLMDEWAASFHRTWEELVSTAGIPMLRAVDTQTGRGTTPEDWRFAALERALYRQTIIARNRTIALENLLAETRALRARLEAVART